MSRLLLVAIALIASLALVGLGYQTAKWQSGGAVTVWSTGPTITHLESMAELVSLKVHVADVLVGQTDAYRGSWLIKGDALLAIDLGKAKIEDTDKTIRRARVLLPLPRVLTARVDHDRTRTWNVEKTTWIPW